MFSEKELKEERRKRTTFLVVTFSILFTISILVVVHYLANRKDPQVVEKAQELIGERQKAS